MIKGSVINWFVYIIQSETDDTLYTGISVDPEKRLLAHNNNKGAKRTKGRGPWRNVWLSKEMDKSSASKLEYKIKKLSRESKLNMIEGNALIAG